MRHPFCIVFKNMKTNFIFVTLVESTDGLPSTLGHSRSFSSYTPLVSFFPLHLHSYIVAMFSVHMLSLAVALLVAITPPVEALTLCPEPSVILGAKPSVSADTIATSGASIAFSLVFRLARFPPPAPYAAWPINVTSGIVLRAFRPDNGDGFTPTIGSPRGFTGDGPCATYLQTAAGHDYSVRMDSSNTTHVAMTLTVMLQPCSSLNLQLPEEVAVALPAGFFGSEKGLNGTGSQNLCYAFLGVPVGSFVVLPTAAEEGVERVLLLAQATAWLAMGLTGLLGIGGSPSAAVDAQTLLTLGSTVCSVSTERAMLDSRRPLVPFGVGDTAVGMLWGSAVALGATWTGWLLLTAVAYACQQPQDRDWTEAGAAVRCPGKPFAITAAVMQGVVFVAVRAFVRGMDIEDAGAAAGGLFAVVFFAVVFPIVTVFYAFIGISAQLVERIVEPACVDEAGQQRGGEGIMAQLLWPRALWLPLRAGRANGYIFSDLMTRKRWLSAFTLLPPIAMGIAAGVEPTSREGCAAQFGCLAGIQAVLAVLTTLAAPTRVRLMGVLRIATHAAIGAVAAVVAVSIANETATPSGVAVPVSIACALVLLRLAAGLWTDLYELAMTDGLIAASPPALTGVLWWGDPGKKPPRQQPPLPPPPPPPPPQLQQEGAESIDEDEFFASLGLEKPAVTQEEEEEEKEPAPEAAEADDFFDDLLLAAKPKRSRLRAIAFDNLIRSKRVINKMQDAVHESEQHEMFGDVTSERPDFLRGGKRGRKPGGLTQFLTEARTSEEELKRRRALSERSEAMLAPAMPPMLFNVLPDGATGTRSRDYTVAFRVEKGELRRQPAKDFGSFLEGDAYVVENHKRRTFNNFSLTGDEPSPKGGSDDDDDEDDDPAGEYELYAWIGRLSTPDESSAVVALAVQRDECLESDFHPLTFSGGYPITRLFQGHETSQFLSLFAGHSLRVHSGGIDHFGDDQPVLFHVHGTSMRDTAVTQVPPTIESLDEGDVFILDLHHVLYVFQGKECAPMERMAAARYAMDISTSRSNCRVVVVSTEDSPDEFWERLGSCREEALCMPLKREEPLHPCDVPRLFQVDGPKKFTKLAEGSAEVRGFITSSQHVYIFDMCHAVFVWVGKEVENYVLARGTALEKGCYYLKAFSELHVPLTRVVEGFEGRRFADLLGR
jgi:gelsolin